MNHRFRRGKTWNFRGILRIGLGLLLLGSLANQSAKPVNAGDSVQGDCVDSDGGYKYYRPGKVIEFLGMPVYDQCQNPETLLEYTCSESGEATSEEYLCPNGCIDGACVGPNIVVIGWDGAQWDHVEQCFNRELGECPYGLPNLAKLSSGRIFQSTVTNGPTNTKPGWAQMLTGYNTDVIRVYESRHYFPIPEGYTVFEKVKHHFGEDQVRTIFISGKGVQTGGEEGEVWYLTRNHLDYFESKLYPNWKIGAEALAQLEASQNDLIFAFFLFWEPDTTGHKTGEDAVEYSTALLDADQWLGKIVDKLDQLGILNNTLIYVTTDHGFDEIGYAHANAPFGFLATNDSQVMRNADRRDLAATILERYQIAGEDDTPDLNGYSLYAKTPLACIPKGEAYLDYPGAPACCSGLSLINLDKRYGQTCVPAFGGIGNSSGYCTNCGNGACEQNESWCNCPVDCPQYLSTSMPLIMMNPILGKQQEN